MEFPVGRKTDKATQRKSYKESFKKIKDGHGGLPVKKRVLTALDR
jgi:hypothetical protein